MNQLQRPRFSYTEAASLPAQPWSDDLICDLDTSGHFAAHDRANRCDLDSISTHYALPASEPATPASRSAQLQPFDASFPDATRRTSRAAPQQLQQHAESEVTASQGASHRDDLTSDDPGCSGQSPPSKRARGGAGRRALTNPDGSLMSPEEARRMRRVLSNRESARRSRLRKQTQIQQLEQSVQTLTAKNERLEKDLSEQQTQHRKLTHALRALQDNNTALRKQVEMWSSMANLTKPEPRLSALQQADRR